MSEDRYAGEAFFDGARLCGGDGGLESESGGVALAVLGGYETEGYQVVGVGEGEEVFPEFGVESRQGGEDKDGFLIVGGVGGGGKVVELVMDYRRGYSSSIRLFRFFAVCCCWRGQRIRCWRIVLRFRC